MNLFKSKNLAAVMKILTDSKRNARCFEDSEWLILDIESFFFHTLLEWGSVLPSFYLHALLFPSMFFLIIVIWVTNFCQCSTFPVYLGWLFFNKKLLRYLSKEKKKSNQLKISNTKRQEECRMYPIFILQMLNTKIYSSP